MNDWIRIVTPDGEKWTDQEHLLRRSDIRSLRLVKKLVGSGPDNGVDILIAPESYASWTNHYWIRCPSFEAARELYEHIAADIGAEV